MPLINKELVFLLIDVGQKKTSMVLGLHKYLGFSDSSKYF